MSLEALRILDACDIIAYAILAQKSGKHSRLIQVCFSLSKKVWKKFSMSLQGKTHAGTIYLTS